MPHLPFQLRRTQQRLLLALLGEGLHEFVVVIILVIVIVVVCSSLLPCRLLCTLRGFLGRRCIVFIVVFIIIILILVIIDDCGFLG
jgi:hypothetical protein